MPRIAPLAVLLARIATFAVLLARIAPLAVLLARISPLAVLLVLSTWPFSGPVSATGPYVNINVVSRCAIRLHRSL